MASVKLKMDDNNNKMPIIKVKRLIPISFLIVLPKYVSNVSNDTIIKRKISQKKINKKVEKTKKKDSVSSKIKNKLKVENATKLCRDMWKPKRKCETAILNLRKYMKYDNDECSLIHNAVYNNDLVMLKNVTNDIEKNDYTINLPTEKYLYTPLHIAIIIRADVKIMNFLLSHGANPLIQDKLYKNCFHHAAICNSHKYIKVMIEHMLHGKNATKLLFDWYHFMGRIGDGYELDYKLTTNYYKTALLKIAFSSTDEQGNTPIMECVCRKNFKNLLFILKKLPNAIKGEIVNFRNQLNGKTALFLSGQCDLDENHQSMFTTKAKDCVLYLLTNGADPLICSYAGHSSLKLARATQNIWLLKIITLFSKS